jgi:leader peptidase (prepilin peptidase) / N-methyltransferase
MQMTHPTHAPSPSAGTVTPWWPSPDLAVASAAAVTVVALGVAAGHPAASIALLGAAVVAAGRTAAIDRATFRLPNALVAAVAVLALGAAVVNSTLTDSLLAAAIGILPYLAFHLTQPAGFGFGDVKFGGACGAIVGVIATGGVLLMLATSFLLAALLRARRPQGAIALGPTIAFGTHLALTSTLVLANL